MSGRLVRGGVGFSSDACRKLCHGLTFLVMRLLAALLALTIGVPAYAAGNVVEITYDNVGNITQIKRQAATGFAITGFDPASGAVGAAVTIYGTGFDPTPSSNTVKFNGTTATVSASASGSISTTVPSGATTGRIAVTVGGVTATSAQDFVVTIPGAPIITSFTPTSGAAAALISVVGSNFDVAATTVKLNASTATSTIASSTALSFTVPPNTASGRISATTAIGTGVSAQDFLVAPPGVSLSDVILTRRLSAGAAPVNVAVGTPSKHAMILFDGTAGGFYTMQFSQMAVTPSSASVPYKVVGPDNAVLATGAFRIEGLPPTIHFPKLVTTGTYTVVVSPGSATFNANVRVGADPVVVVDGAAATPGLDSAGQSARFVFDLAAGQRVGMGISGLTLSAGGTSSTGFTLYLPNGTSGGFLLSCFAASGSNVYGICDSEVLAATAGTYAIVAQSPGSGYATFNFSLSNDATGTLSVDVAQDVTLSRVGQDARYTFQGAVGDSRAVEISAISPLPDSQSFGMSVLKPDGTGLTSCGGTASYGVYCELGTLATAGTYTVVVDPSLGAYGSFKLTLKGGPLLSATDPPTAFSSAVAQERARFRFAATTGQNLAVAISSLVNTAGSASSALSVAKPDGSPYGSSAFCSPPNAGGTCKLNLTSLPVTGTYSVTFTPGSGVKVTGNVTLSSDLTGTLTEGVAQSLSTTRSGQNARYTFSGAAGQSTSVRLLGTVYSPAGSYLNLRVIKPDGNELASDWTLSAKSILVNLPSLPTTGTYTAVVDPAHGITFNGSLVLDPGISTPIDGATATVTTSIPGEPLRYYFTGTAGQRIDVGISGVTFAATETSTLQLTLRRTDGNDVSSVACGQSDGHACDMSVASLPSTGTYAVILKPPVNNITAGTFAVSTPLTGTFVMGDPAQTVAITRPGQTARYTFSGTAAQLLRLNWSSAIVQGTATVYATVLKPDGSTLSSGSFVNGATGGMDIAALPSTGAYTVVFDPSRAATLSTAVTLSPR